MTGSEFAELVEWVQDRWGTSDEVWANASRFYSDFERFDAADVWSAIYRKELGSWAPRPMELLTATRDIVRQKERPALPESTDRSSYAEWCMRTHGEVIPLGELVRRRHAELEGRLVEEATEARLPMESGLIEDGARPKIECRSPLCDVHRTDPLPTEGLL